MQIDFISINPLTNIPSLRFFVDYFIKQHKAKISITQIYVESFNNYYSNNPNIDIDKIVTFKTHKEYNQKKNTVTKQKYIKIIKKIFTSFKQRNDFAVTTDFQVLFFMFWMKLLFKTTKTKIIYLQFEMIEENLLGKINKFFFKYVQKKINLIDLAIFPEINRQDYFLKQTSLHKNKCLMIPNTCKKGKIQIKKHPIFNNIPKDKLIIGHIGNVGNKDHYFEHIIQIITSLKSNPKLFFLFIGFQTNEVKKRIKQLNLPNLLFVDSIPHQDLPKIYSFLDVGLILYKGVSPNFELCAPNKLYEYWSYDIPVVAHQLTGLKSVYKIPEQGKLVNFNDINNIEKAILSFVDTPSNKTALCKYFITNLSISKFIDEFDKRLYLLL